MSHHQTDLRPWLQDAVDFIIQQVDLARSPADQFAAVVTAQSIIPYLRSRLKEDKFLAANFALVLGIFIDPDHGKRIWMEMAKEAPDVFAKSADDLIGLLNALKTVLELPPPQSK
jgi:hypothetical protein